MSLKKIGKTKIWILFGGALILILAGALFYYYFFYETPVEEWDNAEYSSVDDYLVQGDIVKNDKAGLSFVVPEGWSVDKEESQSYISLLSSDANGLFFLETGCKITIESRKIKTNVQAIKNFLMDAHSDWRDIDSYDEIVFSGKKALRNEFELKASAQYYVSVHVPLKGLIHTFGMNSNISDKHNCVDTYEQFLGEVTIK